MWKKHIKSVIKVHAYRSTNTTYLQNIHLDTICLLVAHQHAILFISIRISRQNKHIIRNKGITILLFPTLYLSLLTFWQFGKKI